jgi:peroxiredoxin
VRVKTPPTPGARGLIPPEDDGAARHLLGLTLPALHLARHVAGGRELGTSSRQLVLFFYPATGVPNRDPSLDPAPGWDDIPGAPGCTAQCVAYRDELPRIRALGFDIVGISAQASAEQAEFAARQAIPFPLLSDPQLLLGDALGLPHFVAAGRRFYKRLTLVVVNNRIMHAVYPVFPPHDDARSLAEWLQAHPELRSGHE